MALQDLANLGELLSGIAVVASLIYLALQIRQNTNAVIANTHQELFASFSVFAASVTENPDVSRIVLKASADYEKLDPDELMRFEAFATRLFGQFESVLLHHQRGLVDDRTWPHYEAYYRDQVTPECFRRFWATHRHWYYPDFQAHVDRIFER